MGKLFCDCKTDAEKSAFFLSGRAFETGIIAAAISNDVAMAYHRCDEFKKEVAALRARIEEMEQQEPVAKVRVHRTGGNAGLAWSVAPLNDFDSLPLMRDGDRLYALPGAKGEAK